MENGMITIARYDYDSLLKKAERIAAVERLINCGKYVSDDEIFAVLGIKKKENADGEV